MGKEGVNSGVVCVVEIGGCVVDYRMGEKRG